MRCQQACTRLRMSWCLGLLEVSPWGQSLTVCPSDCPTVCRSSPTDWNPERVPGDTGAWESRGEDHDSQHTPVRRPLQQGFQAGQWAAAYLSGWQQAQGAGWGRTLRAWVVVRGSGRSATAVLHRSCPGGDWSSTKWPLGRQTPLSLCAPGYHPRSVLDNLLSTVCDGVWAAL